MLDYTEKSCSVHEFPFCLFFLNHRTQKQHFTRREPVFLRDRHTELPMRGRGLYTGCIYHHHHHHKPHRNNWKQLPTSSFVESPIHILSRTPQ